VFCGTAFTFTVPMLQVRSMCKWTEECIQEIKSYVKLVLTRTPTRLLYKTLNIKIHKTIILPFVLYRCEIWFLSLREVYE
jgi:hypothetical protein